MKNKEMKLIGISVFVFLVVLAICSIFIKDEKFILVINYLSIPVLILSILISINKYYQTIYSKLENDFTYTGKQYLSYVDLLESYTQFIQEQGENADPKLIESRKSIAINTKILFDQSTFLSKKKKNIEKKRDIFFWIMLIPLCSIFIMLALCGFIDMPKFDVYFLNLFSLIVLVFDWVIVDWITQFMYNKICSQIIKIDEDIKEREIEYEI